MSIRSFIAITPSQNMVNALGDAAAKMAYQDKSNAVNWVNQENFHLTLAFLGEREERELDLLADELDIHLPQSSLSISTSRFSPFPESKPKLIAAMVEPEESLINLHQSVISSLNSANIPFDKRRFNPHITLGRFRHSRNRYSGAIPNSFELRDEIMDVAIYESVLSTHGAEYEAIYRFPLDFDSFDLTELEE